VTDSRSSEIVERRQRYIERQREMRPETVNVRFQSAAPEGSGPSNRHGMPVVPVGQHLVKNWPVLDLGEQPDVPLDKWKLEVSGLVENPVTLDWARFMALPQVEDVSDFHCVTTWSSTITGAACGSTRLPARVPKDNAAHSLHRLRLSPRKLHPYTVNVRSHAPSRGRLLVHTWEGKPLPRSTAARADDYAELYAWKGAKWIRKIEFLAADKRGFWEERGYSNTAEPWFNDRFSY
jgi:DMSO/TMAO reductase YedYZ molybdopterin-dependent catalytic subunit